MILGNIFQIWHDLATLLVKQNHGTASIREHTHAKFPLHNGLTQASTYSKMITCSEMPISNTNGKVASTICHRRAPLRTIHDPKLTSNSLERVKR